MDARLLLLLASLLAPAAAPADDGGCRRCEFRGVLPCGEHDAEELAFEEEVQFCSVVARCEDCRGALLVDCEKCDGGPDSARIPARQEKVAEWMSKQELFEFFGEPLSAVETEHYRLIVDCGTLKERRRKVDEHEVMHLIARDVERVATLVREHYELGEPGEGKAWRGAFPTKMRMWIWERPEDHQRVMLEYLQSGATGDFKLLGLNPVFSVRTEPPFDTVQGARMVFTHNASHMLLSCLYRELWTGDIGGGWFDAGAGHWYEYAVHGRSTNYCIEEATAKLEFHDGLWRAPIRKWLEREPDAKLGALLIKHTGAMTLPEQALCWSFYDWLVAEHRAALPKLQKGLKERREARELLADVLGMPLLEAEQAWRAWVSEVYPLRGDEPRVREE